MPTFELLSGMHIQNGPDGKEQVFDSRYPGHNIVNTDHLPPEAQDLEAHNGRGVAPKFRRIHETPAKEPETVDEIDAQLAALQAKKAALRQPHQQPATSASAQSSSQGNVNTAAKQGFNTVHTDRLKTMSLNELKQLAENEEIPLGNAKTQAEVLKVLTAALGSK